MTFITAVAQALIKHSNSCPGYKIVKDTKDRVPCPECGHIKRWMLEAPAHLLNELLSEPPTIRASFQFATLVQESVLRNGEVGMTGRSQANQAAGMRLLKDYEELGGKLRG